MYTGSEAQVSASAEQQTCSSEGATIVSSCPTAGLVGCCLINQGTSLSTNQCMHTGTANDDEETCTSNGSLWSTTPNGEETDGTTITSVDSNTEQKSNSQTVCTVTSNATLTM